MMIPDVLTPFKTLIAPAGISLAIFKEEASTIIIEGHEASSAPLKSKPEDRSKKRNVSSSMLSDDLVGYVKIFCFSTKHYEEEESLLNVKWKGATKIIKRNTMPLKHLELMISHLPAKTLLFLCNKTQIFLKDCVLKLQFLTK